MKSASRVITSILVPAAIVLASFSSTQRAVADDEMSLKDKQQWAEISKHMDDKAAAATEKCGTTITAKFDIASFKGQDIFKQSPTAMCRDAINTVAAICGTDSGKAAVKKSLSTITCRKSTDGTKVSRENKALVVHVDNTKTAITGKAKAVSSWKTALEENFVADAPSSSNGSEMPLRDRLEWDQMITHIEEKAKNATDKCGTPISARFDIASFKGQDLAKQSPTAQCRDSINTLASTCSTELGKAAVKQKVASVWCKRSDEGTKVSRDGTKLVVHIDPAKPGIVSKSGGTSWKSALDEAL